MSDKHNNDEGSLLPFQRTQPAFRGFPEFRSNVLYCPKQFFSVVLPHSSVNCIRLVAYMLRKTLGWVDDSGEPLQEQHQFTYRELEASAGIVHSGLRKAINEALTSRFIACVQQARVQTRGVRAQSATYELRWDEDQYTDELEEFHGFYLPQGYIDREGQNRIGRKNIPNVFFDYLIRNENRGVIRVVGTLLWYSIDWGKGGERRQPIRKSLRDLVELTQLDKSSVVRALDEAEQREYVERLERGVFDLSGRRQSSTTLYGIHWTNEYVYTHEGLPIEVTQPSERSKNATHSIKNVWIAPGSQPLEMISHSMTEVDGYESLLAEFLAELPTEEFDFVVIDCPNQISPLMENAIVPTDVFVVPIESTKAVASYANFFALVQKLRAEGDYRMLHVLNNITLQGVRNSILRFMTEEEIPIAKTEVRNCGWLAQVDRHGGSIFDYRPNSKGAEDIPKLQQEILASIRQTERRMAIG